MANLSKIMSQIERRRRDKWMENTIEHTNPNLRPKKLKYSFHPMTTKEEMKANIMKAIQDTINHMPDRERVLIGSIVVDHEFVGYITYRVKPFSWNDDEIRVDFTNDVEFMEKFIKIKK